MPLTKYPSDIWMLRDDLFVLLEKKLPINLLSCEKLKFCLFLSGDSWFYDPFISPIFFNSSTLTLSSLTRDVFPFSKSLAMFSMVRMASYFYCRIFIRSSFCYPKDSISLLSWARWKSNSDCMSSMRSVS